MMIRNKRGSVTIYVLLFFLTMVSMLMTFINVSKTLAVNGVTRELGLLWAESVLAEYDRNLFDRYGIFAFYGTERSVEKKLDRYAQDSFGDKSYVSYEGAHCDLYDTRLRIIREMKKQVVSCGKLSMLGKLAKRPTAIVPLEGAEKGGALMEDLPSEGCGGSFKTEQLVDLVKNGRGLTAILKEGTDPYFENRYLMTYFKNEMSDHELGQTHWRLEAEYVICGKKEEEENRKAMKRRIIGIRFALNMWYLMNDPERSAETLAAAELLTPGPAAPATQKALESAWSMAESVNDYKLLINGRKVPFLKGRQTWAISLENITKRAKPAEKEQEEESITFPKETPLVDMDNPYGENYEEYLSLMAYLMDENVKLLRMMDLIQINMREQYYGGFRIADYNTGVHAVLRINGKDYAVQKEYQPKE